jgi:hypothetical protein
VKVNQLYISALLFIAGGLYTATVFGQKEAKPLPPLSFNKNQPVYTADSVGNRIPDFSYAGYKASEKKIPDIPVKIIVPVTTGDATNRIQSAIDYVSKLPADKNGLRGAVLLQAGTYQVEGALRLHTSGVVLRGSGTQEQGTILFGAGKDRATLITIAGTDNKKIQTGVAVTSNYIPVNSHSIQVADISAFKKGDAVILTRKGTKAWIDKLGTDHFGGGITSLGWKPDQRNITWRRIITDISGNTITLDAPVTTAIDKSDDIATVAVYSWPGLIRDCGVENLQLVSAYDKNNLKDEDHRWMAIVIDNAADSWVKQVTVKHFAGSAVAVYSNASKITVEDCIALAPVSETGGQRRISFFTEGQQTLFQRCYTENAIHGFATGFCTPGPTAFVQCEASNALGFSGGLDSWSSGVLFDVVSVDGNAISFFNRGQDGQGAGWNMANSVLWNCSAARIDNYQPPMAQNWAFGSWSQFAGDGYWNESNNHLQPRSLFYAQLKERVQNLPDTRQQLLETGTEASSSPSVAVANELTKQATIPVLTLQQYIIQAGNRTPVDIHTNNSKTIDETGVTAKAVKQPAAALQIQQGWLTRGNAVLAGNSISAPWWNGSSRPYATDKAQMALTRFVPGKTGNGLTDDLNEVTDSMLANNTVAFEQNYALWYDRRRDDHERIRRMDGEVWPPFYEVPFARSGQAFAWDGLSKYDLTKNNNWYWSRLKQFSDLADEKGLLLIHQNYFQHNIIEAGAHYADFAWRTANNINQTGFPEPVPYAGDKRIFMAELFYDTANTVRRQLHQQYIRQCLNNFSANNGVIQLIGEEYTGPLHFVQFWLNTILEWQASNYKKAIIGLSTTKDVQDVILQNPVYRKLIDVIDIKYWYYQANGELYAPAGGQNLAPRQHARLLKPKGPSSQQVYRAVSEYKLRYPEKAILYSGDAADKNGWTVLMAGGSLANVKVKDKTFLQAIGTMQPVTQYTDKQWVLSGKQTGAVIYVAEGNTITANLEGNNSYEVAWVNTGDGSIQKTKQIYKAGIAKPFTMPGKGNWVLWLKKK